MARVFTRPTSNLLLLILVAYLALSCNTASRANTADLKAAYEEFEAVYTEALLTLDTTKLPSVATGETLRSVLASVETRRNFSVRYSEEGKVRNFRIQEYEDNRAIIEANKFIRDFIIDSETGERNYPTSGRWYKIQAEMVREDGRWKVKETEAKNWDE